MEPNLLSLSKPKRSVLANMGINHSLSKLWVTPSFLLLSTHDFFFFPSLFFLPNHLSVLWFELLHTPASISIKERFGTQEHLPPICMRDKKKKKNGAQELKRYLWSLWVGGCARDRRLQVWNYVLFTFFGFWYYKIMVAVKIWFFTQMGQNI